MRSTVDVATLLRGRGFALCLVKAGDKKPTYPGWPTFSREPSDFADGGLLSLIAGPLSDAGRPGHALVVLDIDDMTAVGLADAKLPPTGMIEGRPGKPKSHRYYLVPLDAIPKWGASSASQASKAAVTKSGSPGPFMKSFRHRDTNAEVLKFIGTGGQAVCAPSLHTSGETREWEGGAPGEPAVVPFLGLWRAACDLAVEAGARIPDVQPRPVSSSPGGRRYGGTIGQLMKRVAAYLAKVDPAISGQDGHVQLLLAARYVVWGFDLGQELGFEVLKAQYNPRCTPPWSDAEVLHKVREADKPSPAFDKPRGYLRDAARTGGWNDTPIKFGSGASETKTAPRVAVSESEASRPTQDQASTDNSGDDTCELGDGDAGYAGAGDRPAACDVRESMFDPFRLGRLLVPRRADGVPLMLRHNAEWWEWIDGCYAKVGDDEFRNRAWSVIRRECEALYPYIVAAWEEKDGEGNPPAVPKVTHAMVSGAVSAAEAMCAVPGKVAVPALLDTVPDGAGGVPSLAAASAPREYIAVANGLLDVEELLAEGSTDLLAPTPLYFTHSTLPVAFDPAADCPTFLKFLDRVTDEDHEKQAVLQEMVGYLLRADTRFQTFFVLTGDGGNGKSTFIAVISALLGEHNITAVPLERFGERFALTPTIGKLLNAVADVGELDAVAEATFKAFVGGDSMQFDRKGKTPLDRKPTARSLLSCNTLPRFTDATDGVWRRYQAIPFAVTITAEEKVRGMDKPEFWGDEAPGILNWALCGMTRLYKNNAFTVSKAAESLKAEHRLQCSTTTQFLTDLVKASAGGAIETLELYSAYREWCRKHGNTPVASSKFGNALRKQIKNVLKGRPGANKRTYVYQGIEWAHGRPVEYLAEFDKNRHPQWGPRGADIN